MGKLHLVFISKILWPRNWIRCGITAVAAIVEHNTSGIISRKDAAITSPKDLVGKKYGTWNDPIELEMIKSMMKKRGLILIK